MRIAPDYQYLCRAAAAFASTLVLACLAGCSWSLHPLGNWEPADCTTLSAVDIDRLCWIGTTYDSPEYAAPDIESWAEDQFDVRLRVSLRACLEADDAATYRCEMTLYAEESDEEIAKVVVDHSPHGDPTHWYLIVPLVEV